MAHRTFASFPVPKGTEIYDQRIGAWDIVLNVPAGTPVRALFSGVVTRLVRRRKDPTRHYQVTISHFRNGRREGFETYDGLDPHTYRIKKNRWVRAGTILGRTVERIYLRITTFPCTPKCTIAFRPRRP